MIGPVLVGTALGASASIAGLYLTWLRCKRIAAGRGQAELPLLMLSVALPLGAVCMGAWLAPSSAWAAAATVLLGRRWLIAAARKRLHADWDRAALLPRRPS